MSNVSIHLLVFVKDNNIRHKIATLFLKMQRINFPLALLPMKKAIDSLAIKGTLK